MNDGAARRILIVDDSRIERMKLSRALAGQDCAVATADGGPRALEMLRSETFDLVFLDIVMPDMDGLEVLRQMKRDNALRAIPVVVVSGVDDTQSIQSCLALGAKAHLPKPVSADALKGCVETCLSNGNARDAKQ